MVYISVSLLCMYLSMLPHSDGTYIILNGILQLVSLSRESKAHVVFLDCRDHVVLKENLVLRGSRDPLVSVAPLDPLECLDHLD